MNTIQKQKTISAYMASVRFMDEQVGRLLRTLDNLKLRDNTIVIFISDHGYNLSQHDCWSKISLWEGSVRVPLIISAPGYNQNYGTTSSTLSQLIDLYPTLTELCGYKNKQPKILQGKSLVPWIIDSKTEDPGIPAFTITYGGEGASLTDGRWRYNRWGEVPNGQNEELYDHQADPEELNNLADNPTKKAVLVEMRKKLYQVREKARSAIKQN